MAQLIQARNDSHIISPGHAPNAPLIQASAPPPERFRVTGDDPNARPDDRSVWNPQTNQWERGTVALANQNARLSDERRGQMALEADMRRSLNTPINVGTGRMPTQTELDELTGRVRAGANRKWAEVMGMPGTPASSPRGKSGVTFTGGGNPAEAATVDPMARWIEAAAFLRDADGNIKEGWQEQAKWLEGQMQAEWARRYGYRNGEGVVGGIIGTPGAAAGAGAPTVPGTGAPAPAASSTPQGMTPNDDNLRADFAQTLGVAPARAPAATPADTAAAAPGTGAPARRGKFRIAKSDGSYTIEGEGNEFVETIKKDGETIDRQGTLDELPVGSVGANAKPLARSAATYGEEYAKENGFNLDTPENRGIAKARFNELRALKESYDESGQAFPLGMTRELDVLNKIIPSYEQKHGEIQMPGAQDESSEQEEEEKEEEKNVPPAKSPAGRDIDLEKVARNIHL